MTCDDAELIESFAYVELNLEAAHERLNNVFMLVAVSIYMDAPSDQLLVSNVLYGQILAPSKNYLNEKKDAIASMAAAHPANKVFADYGMRADALFGDRAIPFSTSCIEESVRSGASAGTSLAVMIPCERNVRAFTRNMFWAGSTAQ